MNTGDDIEDEEQTLVKLKCPKVIEVLGSLKEKTEKLK
jgi:hypothetical protein